jgi:hypothetical protein
MPFKKSLCRRGSGKKSKSNCNINKKIEVTQLVAMSKEVSSTVAVPQRSKIAIYLTLELLLCAIATI